MAEIVGSSLHPRFLSIVFNHFPDGSRTKPVVCSPGFGFTSGSIMANEERLDFSWSTSLHCEIANQAIVGIGSSRTVR